VQILTRSPLICRDVDVLEQLNCDVGLTVTEPDGVGRLLDDRSPRVEARLEALARLRRHGLPTFAFVGPLFGHLVDQPERLNALFAGIRRTGTRQVYVAHGRLGRQAIARWLEAADPDQADLIRRRSAPQDGARKEALARLVEDCLRANGLKMRTGSLIDH